jgi:hypothetical protein
MENMFIKINPINGLEQANISYDSLKGFYGFLSASIKDVKEYREWVYQWRAYEKELIIAIRAFKKLRKNIELGNYYQLQKMRLRVVANSMYCARKEKKEFFKNSILPALNIETKTKELELC